MKLLLSTILSAACVAVTLSAPQFPQYRSPIYPSPVLPGPAYPAPGYYPNARPRAALDRSANILRADSQVTENGFSYAFETDNGIQAQESGVENNGIQAAGSYSYTGDDGQVYTVRYTADAGGFRPEGAHLPTPPPIPAAIARALQFNAQNEARGIIDDGSYNAGKYENSGVIAARYYPNFGRSVY